MRASVLIFALCVAGCAADGPSPVDMSAVGAQQWADAARAQKAARDEQVRAWLAEKETERAAAVKLATARNEAAQVEWKQAQDRLMPQARACLAQNVHRLARASSETADLVADAVLMACHTILAAIAQTEGLLGVPAMGMEEAIEGELRVRVISLVVEERAAGQQPAPAVITPEPSGLTI